MKEAESRVCARNRGNEWGRVRMEGKAEKMFGHSAEGSDPNPLHRSALPKPADAQDYADMQNVAQIFCSHPGSRHGLTICRVSEPQGEGNTAPRARAGSRGPRPDPNVSCWMERWVLCPLRETLAWLQDCCVLLRLRESENVTGAA